MIGRRQLTTAQRAALALDLLPALEAEAKQRKAQAAGQPQGVKSHRPETDEETGRSDAKAAELVGVGRPAKDPPIAEIFPASRGA